MVNIIIAPDSLKGSLSAEAVCDALERGARRVFANNLHCQCIPLADGGEGTVTALLRGAGGQLHTTSVHGPLGASTPARWAILDDGSAAIEMAQASGLTLVAEAQRDAKRACSFGTGEVVRAALDAGCRKLLIGIGGSATTDGGTGALRALGARFLDSSGHELLHGGAALKNLAYLDLVGLDARLEECEITVLCDVTNPLCGPRGAAHVYGPQKGASPADVEALDAALSHYADVTAQALGRDLRDLPGAGAAGGIGFGLLSFLNARLRPGIEVVLEAAHFAEKLETADLVLTAEGALDEQTLNGKTIAGVAAAAKVAKNGAGVPVIAFGGAVRLSGAQLDQLGVLSAFALPDSPITLQESMARADDLLAFAAERALRLWRKPKWSQ